MGFVANRTIPGIRQSVVNALDFAGGLIIGIFMVTNGVKLLKLMGLVLCEMMQLL